MPPSKEPIPEKSIEQIVEEVGRYPVEAYEFVQRGLSYTVEKLHGSRAARGREQHVSGQELCDGLREYSLMQWGLLARTVLRRWNITRTEDFGRIVFALVENGYMRKTDDDDIRDFRDVFDFRVAFDEGYRIKCVEI